MGLLHGLTQPLFWEVTRLGFLWGPDDAFGICPSTVSQKKFHSLKTPSSVDASFT